MNVKTHLSSETLRQLEREATKPKTKKALRIVRLAKEGLTGHAIAQEVGLSRRRVCSWIARFNQHGLNGVLSRPV